MSKSRAHNWASDDRVEDGYLDTPMVDINRNPEEKGYDSEPSPKQTQKIPANCTLRLLLSNPLKKG